MVAINVAEPLLTVPQLCERTGLSSNAIYTAICRGKLPVVRLGRRVRFRWSDIERTLQVQPATALQPALSAA